MQVPVQGRVASQGESSVGAKLHTASGKYNVRQNSDINVTPFVDVMLVLLIIFMVAAPLMTAGINVDLPKTTAAPLIDQKPPISVGIDASGKLFVDRTPVDVGALVAKLRDEAAGDLTRRIHVRADQSLAYGVVVKVMGEINTAGFSRVALVSEAPPAK